MRASSDKRSVAVVEALRHWGIPLNPRTGTYTPELADADARSGAFVSDSSTQARVDADQGNDNTESAVDNRRIREASDWLQQLRPAVPLRLVHQNLQSVAEEIRAKLTAWIEQDLGRRSSFQAEYNGDDALALETPQTAPARAGCAQPDASASGELGTLLEIIQHCRQKTRFAWETLQGVYQEQCSRRDQVCTRIQQAYWATRRRWHAERLERITELACQVEEALASVDPYPPVSAAEEKSPDKATGIRDDTARTPTDESADAQTEAWHRLCIAAKQLGECFQLQEMLREDVSTADTQPMPHEPDTSPLSCEMLAGLIHTQLEQLQKRLATTLRSKLVATLTRTSAGGVPEAVHWERFRELAQAYQDARLALAFESDFREAVVRPLVQRLMKEANVNTSTAPETMDTGESALIRCWQSVIAQLEQVVAVFITPAARIAMQVTGVPPATKRRPSAILYLDLLGRGFWPVIADEIREAFVTKLSPADAELFHRAYCLMQRFAAHVRRARAAVVPEAADLVIRHEATTAFWRCWNLAAYFQVRSTGLIERLEHVLQLSPEPVTTLDARSALCELWHADPVAWACFQRWHAQGVRCWQTLYTVAAIQVLWSGSVFVSALVSESLRLTLRLIARLVVWLEQGSAAGGPFTAAECAWMMDDLRILQRQLPAAFETLWRDRVSELDEVFASPHDAGAARALPVAETFTQALEWLVNRTVPGLEQRVTALILEQCTEKMQPLRGLLAAYRMMSNKPMPSRATPFIHAVLLPLDSFLKELTNPWQQQQQQRRNEVMPFTAAALQQWRRRWATHIAVAVIHRYLDTGFEVVRSIEQAEAALRRLHLHDVERAADPDADRTETERTKILQQMRLDVRWLMDQLKDQQRYGGVDILLEPATPAPETPPELVRCQCRIQELLGTK